MVIGGNFCNVEGLWVPVLIFDNRDKLDRVIMQLCSGFYSVVVPETCMPVVDEYGMMWFTRPAMAFFPSPNSTHSDKLSESFT